MGSLFRLDVDTDAVFAALDAAVVELEARLLANAEVTANRIADEGRARVRRRTGKTAEGITVEQTRAGDGYLVFVQRPEMPGLPGWIEFGTRSMTARPFLFASARLEEGPHERRTREIVDETIGGAGLGG